MSEELKPCPFCDGAPRWYDDDSHGSCGVLCATCDIGFTNSTDNPQACRDEWNRRAPDPRHAKLLEAAKGVLCPAEYDDAGPYQSGVSVEDIKALRAAVEECER